MSARGFADNFKPDPRHPFSAVEVESAIAADGAMLARVRMTLTEAVRPRVRSARNMIYVEADRLDAAPGATTLMGPSSVIRDVRVTQRGTSTAVTLLATARLVATSIQEPTGGIRREGRKEKTIQIVTTESTEEDGSGRRRALFVRDDAARLPSFRDRRQLSRRGEPASRRAAVL